jgi:hypothetical protein
MLPHGSERAYLIREVKLATAHEPKRTFPGAKLPKALRRFGKHLKTGAPVGSVVLIISEMTSPPNAQPKETTTYAVISDTDGQLYLSLPR